jgi:hypothetical protein
MATLIRPPFTLHPSPSTHQTFFTLTMALVQGYRNLQFTHSFKQILIKNYVQISGRTDDPENVQR